jgi:hypothetical protein
MKDRNKRWMVSSVTTAILFAIGAIRFYSRGDITGATIYGAAKFAFLIIAFGLSGRVYT